ncbi:hypothetical protein [Herbiconiux sp. UC225_62]|uniref:hypothetical protein n=1 Tax=Herbiconiux sp. UC225_62 TaxID=3350168 RepID=UPI0036D2366B
MSIQQPRHDAHIDHLGAVACEMATFDEGHELHPIIRRAASATPSQWVDALIVSASSDGWIEFVTLHDATVGQRWHHTDLSDVLVAGSPVAVHGLYGVLAVGDEFLSVRAA